MNAEQIDTVLMWLDGKYAELDTAFYSKAVRGTEALAAQFAMWTALAWQRELQAQLQALTPPGGEGG